MKLIKQLIGCLIFGTILGIIFYCIGIASAGSVDMCDNFKKGDVVINKGCNFADELFVGEVKGVDFNSDAIEKKSGGVHLITAKSLKDNIIGIFPENFLEKLYPKGGYIIDATGCRCEMPEVQSNLDIIQGICKCKNTQSKVWRKREKEDNKQEQISCDRFHIKEHVKYRNQDAIIIKIFVSDIQKAEVAEIQYFTPVLTREIVGVNNLEKTKDKP